MNIKKLLPIIGIVIFVYILSTFNLSKIADVILRINLFYGLLSLFAIIPILIILNFEWQLILKKHRIHVSYLYSLKNILIGFFYGFITPGGLGGYGRVFYLKDESGESFHKCLANLFILSTLDYITLLSLGVAGGFLLSSRVPSILPIFLILFSVTIIIMLYFIRRETGGTFFKKLLFSKYLHQYKDKWDSHIDELYEDIPKIKDLILPAILSIIGWIIWFSELYIISTLFSIDVPIIYFILICAIVHIISLLPITIQGLGTREAALLGLLSIFNVPQENILGFSIFWLLISGIVPGFVGAIVTVFESRRKPKISMEK